MLAAANLIAFLIGEISPGDQLKNLYNSIGFKVDCVQLNYVPDHVGWGVPAHSSYFWWEPLACDVHSGQLYMSYLETVKAVQVEHGIASRHHDVGSRYTT